MGLKIGQQQQQNPAALTRIDSICEKKNYFSHSVCAPRGEKIYWVKCCDCLLLKAMLLF